MNNSTLTPDQINLRLGKFCASELHKLMPTNAQLRKGELTKIGDGFNTYVYEKAAEYLTGQKAEPEPMYKAASLQWGIDHENEAQIYFEAATKMKIVKPGTLINDCIACTPDGIGETLEGLKYGFEIKCPYNSGNHLKNLLLSNADDLLDLHPEYFWQIYGGFWTTELKQWKFCSYDPRFKDEKRMLILNIIREEKYMDMMRTRVQVAIEMFNSIIEK